MEQAGRSGLVLIPSTDVITGVVDQPKIRQPSGGSFVVGEIDVVKYPASIVIPVAEPIVPKAYLKGKKPAVLRVPVRRESPRRRVMPPEEASSESEDEDEEIPEAVTVGDIRAHLGIFDLDAGGANLAKIRRSFTTLSQPMKQLYNNTVVPGVRELLLNPGMECVPEADRKDVALYAILAGWTQAISECPEMLSTVHELAPKGVAGVIGL